MGAPGKGGEPTTGARLGAWFQRLHLPSTFPGVGRLEALQEHTIPFTGLKDGEHVFEFDLGAPFFEAAHEDEFEGGSVKTTVRMDKSATMLVVNMHLEGFVTVRCDHCNAPLDQRVNGDQRQIFQLHGDDSADDDELVTLDERAHSINLTHYFFECLRLSLPARHVHPEGGCDPDVDAALGRLALEHEPVPDPRWEVLKQLKTKRP